VNWSRPTDSGSTENARLENRNLFKILFKLLYLRFPPLHIRTCVFRTCVFSRPHSPHAFRVTWPLKILGSASISETVQDQRYSYNGKLVGNHMSPIEWHKYQWPWVIFSVTLAVWNISDCRSSRNITRISYIMYKKWCKIDMLLLHTSLIQNIWPINSRHFHWPWMTLKVIRFLLDFSSAIRRTFCDTSHGFNWHDRSRGPSARAKLLVQNGVRLPSWICWTLIGTTHQQYLLLSLRKIWVKSP